MRTQDEGASAAATVVVDTRTEPEMSCADQTNSAFDALVSGQVMDIVADHDPQPLFWMLKAERGEVFTWSLVEDGPELWRARILRG